MQLDAEMCPSGVREESAERSGILPSILHLLKTSHGGKHLIYQPEIEVRRPVGLDKQVGQSRKYSSADMPITFGLLVLYRPVFFSKKKIFTVEIGKTRDIFSQ